MQVIDAFKEIDVEMLVRLFIAALLGLTMGIERELKRKSLGLKTILVISIVSCLLTIVSIQSSYLFPATTFAEIRMDPMRLAAQIVSGVGFLGAGVILRKEDDTVSGLTTAAIVWGAAGIGIATGAGFYAEAVIGVALLLVSVELIPAIIKRIGFKGLSLAEIDVKLILSNREDIDGVIGEVGKNVLKLKSMQIIDLKDATYSIELIILVHEKNTPIDVYKKIAKIEKIDRIEMAA